VSDGTYRGPSSGGLRHAFAHAGTAIVGLVRTRLELAALEFTEERDRARTTLILVVIAALFCTLALLGLSALVVLIYWDTHRVAAMAVVTAIYLIVGVGAIWRLKGHAREAPEPFAQTLAELTRDGEWLSAMVRDTPRSEQGPP